MDHFYFPNFDSFNIPAAKDTTGDPFASYTPCNPASNFHDLNCSHRIEAVLDGNTCGSNCKKPGDHAPFVCSDCLAADVRLEIELAGLSVTQMAQPSKPSRSSRRRCAVGKKANECPMMKHHKKPSLSVKKLMAEDQKRSANIKKIADTELQRRLRGGERMCKIVTAFEDPRMQFWDKFSKDEGCGGLEDDKDAILEQKENRPDSGVIKPKARIEDTAMKAVRDAFERFGL